MAKCIPAPSRDQSALAQAEAVKVATVDVDDVVEILGDIALAKGIVTPANQRTVGEARDGVIPTSAYSCSIVNGGGY